MRKSVALSFVAFAIGLASPAYALDWFTPAVGGSGGNEYVLRCPNSLALIGVTGNAGAYVDRIGPICQGGILVGKAGRKASPLKSATCPSGSMIAEITVRTLRSANHLVDSMLIQCVAINDRAYRTAILEYFTPSPGDTTANLRRFATYDLNRLLGGSEDGIEGTGRLGCGADKAVGLYGRAGASIDALGLICTR